LSIWISPIESKRGIVDRSTFLAAWLPMRASFPQERRALLSLR
jgi:hypothetical protein